MSESEFVSLVCWIVLAGCVIGAICCWMDYLDRKRIERQRCEYRNHRNFGE